MDFHIGQAWPSRRSRLTIRPRGSGEKRGTAVVYKISRRLAYTGFWKLINQFCGFAFLTWGLFTFFDFFSTIFTESTESTLLLAIS